jgi:hypothetical protein
MPPICTNAKNFRLAQRAEEPYSANRHPLTGNLSFQIQHGSGPEERHLRKIQSSQECLNNFAAASISFLWNSLVLLPSTEFSAGVRVSGGVVLIMARSLGENF